MSEEDILRIIKAAKGSTLCKIYLICFVWDKEIHNLTVINDLMFDCGVLLMFEDGKNLTLDNGGRDGQTLSASDERWNGPIFENREDVNLLVEPYGDFVAINFTMDAPFRPYAGGQIEHVEAMYLGESLNGAFFLINGRPLYFFVDGDQGNISWSLDRNWVQNIHDYRLIQIP